MLWPLSARFNDPVNVAMWLCICSRWRSIEQPFIVAFNCATDGDLLRCEVVVSHRPCVRSMSAMALFNSSRDLQAHGLYFRVDEHIGVPAWMCFSDSLARSTCVSTWLVAFSWLSMFRSAGKSSIEPSRLASAHVTPQPATPTQ
jgi:hypothetical protein